MAQTLLSLLRDSRAAAQSGASAATSWRLASDFARQYWLATPDEVPDELVGEFYSMRASAADHLGLADEAIAALRDLRAWARSNDDHALALEALALLAHQSLTLEERPATLAELHSPREMLAQLAQGFADFRPDLDSPTLAEAPHITHRDLPRSIAARLTSAATTGFAVATNLSGSFGDATAFDFADTFAQLVRRFGSKPPSTADQQLWFAQEAWFRGRREEAFDRVTALIDRLEDDALLGGGTDSQTVSLYEAHDMLAHFEMFRATESIDDDASLASVADHWKECVRLAGKLGAEVIALQCAGLAAMALLGEGREGEAWELASAELAATEGCPLSPAVLNLRYTLAEAALNCGLFEEALANARLVAEWSEFSADDARTIGGYSMALVAAAELGYAEIAAELDQRRRAALERWES
ncbi:hypothetical protein [uncultured Corynebacterium sp.]|uniref:hypothetical protein n=1 Tax=uncultured Corynebacterium sp. TaxID=159447 RepID=UPI0025DD9925|nr:hypothetical protein [uncultured Corynebacterium sp.]